MDSITDSLNRIRNAQAVSHKTVDMPFSVLRYKIAKILEEQMFIAKAEKKGRRTSRIVRITLKYEDKVPAISGLKKISKAGQRIYVSAGEIKKVKGGYGIAIISTSKGLMTNKEARKRKIGGEVFCEIW